MHLEIVLCVLVALCVYLCVYEQHVVRLVYLSSKIQGPSWWKIATKHLRNVYTSDLLTWCCQMCAFYNYKPWGVWFYTDYAVIVCDPDTIKEVYRIMPNKSPRIYNKIEEGLGSGLIVINAEDSRRRRKIIRPAFWKNQLECNLLQINQEAAKLVENFRKIVGTNVILEYLIEDAVLAIAMWTLSPVLRLNLTNRSISRSLHKSLLLINFQTTNPVLSWFVTKWQKSGRQWQSEANSLVAELRRAIQEAKCEYAKNFSDPDFQPRNLFEFMLQANLGIGDSELSDEELYADVMILLVASFETTAFTTHVALLLMAIHPEVQQRVFVELDAIFGQSNRNVEMEDLSKMVYLDCVVKEALRLFPSAPVIGKLVEEEVTINGLILPKGCNVIINNMAVSRDPDNFKDPLKFRPERFSPGSEDRHPFAYNPFSHGVRNCPGQAQAYLVIKTVLCYIIRNFEVFPGDGFKSIEDIKVKIAISLQLKRPLTLRVITRKSM